MWYLFKKIVTILEKRVEGEAGVSVATLCHIADYFSCSLLCGTTHVQS